MDKERTASKCSLEQIMSAFAASQKGTETLDLARIGLGQRCPAPCPRSDPPSSREFPVPGVNEDRLGEAMTIRQVAQLLGCSIWTVRQQYMPHGLPHLRASAAGKLVFFREQVIDWILRQQKIKGGNRP
jgi:hypothetical protein